MGIGNILEQQSRKLRVGDELNTLNKGLDIGKILMLKLIKRVLQCFYDALGIVF